MGCTLVLKASCGGVYPVTCWERKWSVNRGIPTLAGRLLLLRQELNSHSGPWQAMPPLLLQTVSACLRSVKGQPACLTGEASQFKTGLKAPEASHCLKTIVNRHLFLVAKKNMLTDVSLETNLGTGVVLQQKSRMYG